MAIHGSRPFILSKLVLGRKHFKAFRPKQGQVMFRGKCFVSNSVMKQHSSKQLTHYVDSDRRRTLTSGRYHFHWIFPMLCQEFCFCEILRFSWQEGFFKVPWCYLQDVCSCLNERNITLLYLRLKLYSWKSFFFQIG